MKNFIENKNKNIGKKRVRIGKTDYKFLEFCQNLEGVFSALAEHLAEVHKGKKVAYISGIITSDGPDCVVRNIQNLRRYAEDFSCQKDLYVVSPVDVLNKVVLTRLQRTNEYRETDYRNFWKSVLESKLIDMLVMTPRWSKSQGAVIEYRTATTTNIEVIFIDGCKCEIKEVSL